MELQLSNRSLCVKPSPTLAINARAKQMKAEGGDIISLSVGEPDFDTPQFIKDAAIEAIQEGFTKYTAEDGIPELKHSIVQKFSRENHLTYTANQIVVSNGAKQSLYNLTQALLNPGDEVIIPAPYWVSYPDMVLLADAIPVIIHADFQQHYKITPAQLEQAITPKTRLVVLNSPSNPSGITYTRDELSALGEVLLQHPQIVIVSDDIYEHILWAHLPFCNIVNACPELYSRTVVVNGVSKSYAMTGWRIGYAAGPEPLMQAIKKIQSQSTSNPNSIAQKAARAGLDGDQSFIAAMVKAFKSRHDFIYQALLSIEGVQCHASHGTFYSFPDMNAVIERMPRIQDDLELADYLLTKAGVALVPGSAFGSPGCMRISYAASMDVLQDAMQRIKTVLA